MKQLTWQAVAVLAVLGAVAVGLGAATPMTSDEIITLVAVLGGIVASGSASAVVASGMQQRVDQIHAVTQAQTPVLENVARRVNGELDQRIAASQGETAEMVTARVLAVLREQGVIR